MIKTLFVSNDVQLSKKMITELKTSEYSVTVQTENKTDICHLTEYELVVVDFESLKNDNFICEMIDDNINCPIIAVLPEGELGIKSIIDCGIEDYIEKPFKKEELLNRMMISIKRSERKKLSNMKFAIDGSEVEVSAQNIKIDNRILRLTKREFNIFKLLAFNPNRIFSSEELYDFLYPIETDTQIRSVSEYIYQLRKKCRPFRINPIDTIYGIGYRMNSNTYAK